MKLNEIRIKNFRNIKDMVFSPSPNINVIFGENGEGKTNLLEAIWLCTGLRSFRGGKSLELINFKEDFARIDVDFSGHGSEQNISLIYQKSESKKSIKLNGVKKNISLEIAGSFLASVFSPTHMELVSGAPEERRRFIDAGISQIKRHYFDLLLKYQKSLIQRNHLIRKIRDGSRKVGETELEIWDESLVGFGSAIEEYRHHYLLGLGKRAEYYYKKISGGKEKLKFKYCPSIQIKKGETINIKIISDMYRKTLAAAFENDLRAGFSTKGVHRDELEFEISGKSARVYASQGQKRSTVLALKLAESDMIKESTGEEPIILLDDIMSELDEKRSEYVLNHIEGKQVFITCCENAQLFRMGQEKGKIIHLKGGEIIS